MVCGGSVLFLPGDIYCFATVISPINNSLDIVSFNGAIKLQRDIKVHSLIF